MNDRQSKAERFLLHEALPKPGEVRIPAPPSKTDDKFLQNFKKIYARLPAAYKTTPLNMGTEVIKIGVTAQLLDELRSLVQELKPKPDGNT
jgi:hypothetical protein